MFKRKGEKINKVDFFLVFLSSYHVWGALLKAAERTEADRLGAKLL